MRIKGTVISANIEERDLNGRDGKQRHAIIRHVLLMCKSGTSTEVCNIRSYDSNWELPKAGTEWETPPVRKYECYSGSVAEVLV